MTNPISSSKEVWKDVKGYEGLYSVSSWGKVRSLKKDKLLKQFEDGNKFPYLRVGLSKNGISKHTRVHRIVAENFIRKSSLMVDHIDGVKFNNRLDNLRYVTNQQNCMNRNEKSDGKSSKYLGVCYAYGYKGKIKEKPWRAEIKNIKKKHIGYFKTEIEAHQAYLSELKKIKEIT